MYIAGPFDDEVRSRGRAFIVCLNRVPLVGPFAVLVCLPLLPKEAPHLTTDRPLTYGSLSFRCQPLRGIRPFCADFLYEMAEACFTSLSQVSSIKSLVNGNAMHAVQSFGCRQILEP